MFRLLPVATLLVAQSAAADTISFDYDVSLTQELYGPQTVTSTLALDAFDRELGTLNSVTIDADLAANAHVFSGEWVSLMGAFFLEVAPGDRVGLLDLGVNDSPRPSGYPAFYIANADVSSSVSRSFSAAEWSGLPGSLTSTFSVFPFVFGSNPPTTSGAATADITLTYSYTVAAVPVPAGLPLALTGLVGFAVISRRKRPS